jgi:excisionase family DNA binding protein
MLTVAEVADVLRVSPSLVYQLVDSGKLPCHRLGKGRGTIRIRLDDLNAYLASCRHEATEEVPKLPRPRLKHLRI